MKEVSSPGDLTGIGMYTSTFYGRLGAAGVDRVRVGLIPLSTLLMYADFRRVARFVHTLTGRVAATGGLALLSIDDGSHEPQVVSAFEQFCDARIRFRSGGGRPQVRVDGLPDQPDDWAPVP